MVSIMGATARRCTRIEQDVNTLMAIGSPGEGHYIAEVVGPALAVFFVRFSMVEQNVANATGKLAGDKQTTDPLSSIH